ncbi:RHS repeat domain-containing protein [Xinfangfangia pollutisoli]|uniref:RHS repeat domain-containing protein n=1 Tax=Xinfangfangia pollutisoli TaxID=2865960 RepID=UPI001CD6BD49|nr:RHS repeat domain-containing protein [Xinfangfangia pollutisoli]
MSEIFSITYGLLGRLDAITNPDGRVTTFTYDDEAGALASITEPSPESGTVSFGYDENGRLISTTNQNGNTTVYSYDATGRLGGSNLPDGSSTAVAEGVFGLTGYIVGALAFAETDIDAILEANRGGPINKHHCYPKYMSGDARIGHLKDLDKKAHQFVHKAMQEYTSVFNLRWISKRGGNMIQRDYSQAYMQRVARNFYDDMYSYFKLSIGC